MIQGLHAKSKTSTTTSSSSSSSSVLLASGITAEDEELIKSIRFRQVRKKFALVILGLKLYHQLTFPRNALPDHILVDTIINAFSQHPSHTYTIALTQGTTTSSSSSSSSGGMSVIRALPDSDDDDNNKVLTMPLLQSDRNHTLSNEYIPSLSTHPLFTHILYLSTHP